MEQPIQIKNFAFKKTLKNEIPTINHLTHNLYSYPAKFIPHVPFYIIRKYLSNENAIILDPFAGSSSTAIEALRFGHNSINIDINPLTNFLTIVKTQRINFDLILQNRKKLDSFLTNDISHRTDNISINLASFIKNMKYSDENFHPDWSNIDHWYPIEFKNLIARMWGFIYAIEGDYQCEFINLAKLSALYLSRYLSYGARDIPKLFRSKRRMKQVEILREKFLNNPEIPYDVFQNKLLSYYKQMMKLRILLDKENITPEHEFVLKKDNIHNQEPGKKKVICLGDNDIISYSFPFVDEFIDVIITSPPYIYAQEYIRSTKLDLYWLGLVDDEKVRKIRKRELGMKKGVESDVVKDKLKNIPSFISITEKLDKKEREKYSKKRSYTKLTYNYFFDMYSIIEKLHYYIKEKGIFSLFVGNPTVLGLEVPCHKIFSEFFSDIGFEIIEVGYDSIISPRLLKGRKNLSPEGMKKEWLIVAQKKN